LHISKISTNFAEKLRMNQEETRLLAQNRTAAENILKEKFGLEKFYDEQWQAIKLILEGKRVLMIERTGFGKSLCYQFPASLFEGTTVIFSPLIALMRDQVSSLNKRGIAARCINSEQPIEYNERAIEDALLGKLKILYIAPERQENQIWIEATRQMKLAMVVVDEAHTISVWGHDFRPAFRRIVNLVRLLPQEMPVLAATATATVRVQQDIERQIGNGITTIRGNLMRHNFILHVIKVEKEEQKMLWLAQHINEIEGTGIIYTGTRVDTENYARWLQFNQIKAIGYNAGLDTETRQDIEKGLKENRWKCVVSTNALGMGIDKPDIRFIIHTQMPASPIHYYQEIGRAGRDGKDTVIVLFYNGTLNDDGIPEDCVLPLAFINGAKPKTEDYQSVIEALKEDILGERELMKATNLKMNQIRGIKADLIEQGIIKEVVLNKMKKYEYQYDAPELDTSAFEQLRESKLNDLRSMVEYVNTTMPRMKFLCEYLGDNTENGYCRCDNTTEPIWKAPTADNGADDIQRFRETYFPLLEVTERGSNIVNGVAASYYGVSTVGNVIHRCKYENAGDFPDYLVGLTLKAYRKTFGNTKADMVMFVPPTISGGLVEHFAAKISEILNIPLSRGLSKTRETDLQKKFRNSYSKKDNVKDAFAINDINVTDKTILLIDDICDSGATLKEIGKMLTKEGAKCIIPLVIAKTISNDNI